MADDNDYKTYLLEFMNFFHAGEDHEPYTDETEFTDDQLRQIIPTDIKRWMCVKAYGVPNPGPEDNPSEGRSASLEYYKKALSYFMPDRIPTWNTGTNTGNPTKSV